MNANSSLGHWTIDFEQNTARFTIEDDYENASIIVDLVIGKQTTQPSCYIKRVIDCWYISDDENHVEKTKVNKDELGTITDILQDEYKKYLEE